jgi:hypothetical protein
VPGLFAALAVACRLTAASAISLLARIAVCSNFVLMEDAGAACRSPGLGGRRGRDGDHRGTDPFERKVMRYEEGIEALFRSGNASLHLLALVHLAGFSSRLPEWVSIRRQANAEADGRAPRQLFARVPGC